MRKAICGLLSTVIIGLVIVFTSCTDNAGAAPLAPKPRLKVATTSSLYDTGLWGYLEPIFEQEYKVEVDVLYANTGIAIEYGKRGDVDVITVHDKARELQFVADGYGLSRTIFAYNYFVLVGPASDPAGVKGMKPEDAFKKLADTATSPFVSRGDSSGTHSKEQAIWKAAGFDYEKLRKSGGWYVEAGRSMGPTLLMANEKQGYTLSDMGTFLAFKGQLSLVPIVDKGSILLNVYSVLPVNPAKVTGVALNAEMAKNMVTFLTSAEIQKLIGDYGSRSYRAPLFTPVAGQPEPTQ